jgi:hypothetical protein
VSSRVFSAYSYFGIVFCYVGPINAVYQQLQCRCCSTSTRLEKHATQNATGAITGRTKCGAVCFYLCIPAGTVALVLASLATVLLQRILIHETPLSKEHRTSHAGKSCRKVCFHEPEQARRYCPLPVKGLGEALISRGGSLTRLMRLAWTPRRLPVK